MRGVKIDKVIEGSAAYECGFRSGDVVIQVANIEVINPIQLFEQISKRSNNGLADVKVLRDDQEIIYKLPL